MGEADFIFKLYDTILISYEIKTISIFSKGE